jgi:hypothetical protein
MLFSDLVLKFLRTLRIDAPLPRGVGVLNPYHDEIAFGLCREFYNRYYRDQEQRTMIIGINPGRYGAGLTGIPFTDPIKLQQVCGIPNELPKKAELSADFVHAMIAAYGGVGIFFKRFYFTSVSPLGFTLNGLNLNYYDHAVLQKRLKPFIVTSLKTQLGFGIRRDLAFCLGEGTNFKFLSALNEKEKFFGTIIPLPHPRFIMQYRRKFLAEYVNEYLEKLSS